MKASVCDAGKMIDGKVLERARKGIAYAMVGSILVLGAGGIHQSRYDHGPYGRTVMEEGPLQTPGLKPSSPAAVPAQSTAPPSASCTDDARLEGVIDSLKRSTVMIETAEALGSGVVIAREGGRTLILTNRHVVQSDTPGHDDTPLAASGMVVHNDGTSARVVRVLLAPQGIDLAVVVVKEDIGPPARLANASIRRGTSVIVLGSPLGIEDSATMGIVSNFVSRQSDGSFPYIAIQTDAAINPGNSGGGLFLSGTGELLGITTFKLRISPMETAEGMGFVIPISILGQFPIATWQEIPAAPAPQGH
ncbi:MAG: trypsin-like peptidase domain-containing protein [Candidatus Micrarchaeia archaeon]